ncbi:hypothetical protein [Actinoplanes sp. NPDC026619]|uniref:hypothetical protein n=1 Tax=Actinoplanes sp. NPDC026619 TaxID=3155798 RepID=UPI003407C89E
MTVLIRFRWVVAAVLGALAGVVTRTTPPDAADFARFAGLLLHGRFAEVYADPWNQAGPAQLLICRLLMAGAQADGTPALGVAALVGAALVAGAMWLCRDHLHREVLAGGLALIWVASPLPWNGHPAELAVPLLWAYAIKLSRLSSRRGDLAAAAVLALGVAIAPWAILGVPCLLAGAPLWRAVRTGIVAVALGVAGYLPFVLTGHFAMFRLHWGISAGTLPSLLGVTDVTWATRLVQGAMVAGGVALIARHCRPDPRAVAIVPLAAGLLRVATDPVYYTYYWFPVAVASVLLIAVDRRRPLIAVALGYLVLLAESGNWIVWGSLGALGLLLVSAGKSRASGATFPAVVATR